MTMIDDKTALVQNTGELREAVGSDNGVELVYFGADITLESGITIDPNRATLVIDGTYNDTVHTFTDIEGTDSAQTFGIRAESSITLTLQNMNIVGRNYFGVPYVYEGVNTDNVTVIYRNVTYTGKQMIFHQRGLTRFLDCIITITGQPSGEVEEVGQVCKVEIGGKTTVQKTNTEDAVFWFFGSSARRPYLNILADADVAIETAHYFMYESYPPDYIIEPRARFVLHTNSGIAWDDGHTVASFLVGEGATFRHIQSTNARSVATLNIDGALTVNEGATFYMQADFANNSPLIRFTGSAASLHLNSPRSFALYNRGSASAKAFFFSARMPFGFAGNQVNMWTDPTALPAAGTFDDQPRYKWNRPSYDAFRIEGRADNTQTLIDFHDFTQEDLDQMSPLSDFKLREAVVFSEGNLPLSVNPVVVGPRPITGKTAKEAKVRVLCKIGGPYPDSDADDAGLFFAASATPVPIAETVTVTANTPFLLTTLAVESREQGELSIVDAPEFIQFTLPPMAEFSDTILPRQIPDITVTVSDIRADKTEWVIWAKITGPLRTAENDVLDDAMIFVSETGDFITLGTGYLPVHTDGPYPEDADVPVTWAANRGALARITTPIRSGRRYATQLDWVVFPAGVRPEGSDSFG